MPAAEVVAVWACGVQCGGEPPPGLILDAAPETFSPKHSDALRSAHRSASLCFTKKGKQKWPSGGHGGGRAPLVTYHLRPQYKHRESRIGSAICSLAGPWSRSVGAGSAPSPGKHQKSQRAAVIRDFCTGDFKSKSQREAVIRDFCTGVARRLVTTEGGPPTTPCQLWVLEGLRATAQACYVVRWG